MLNSNAVAKLFLNCVDASLRCVCPNTQDIREIGNFYRAHPSFSILYGHSSVAKQAERLRLGRSIGTRHQCDTDSLAHCSDLILVPLARNWPPAISLSMFHCHILEHEDADGGQIRLHMSVGHRVAQDETERKR